MRYREQLCLLTHRGKPKGEDMVRWWYISAGACCIKGQQIFWTKPNKVSIFFRRIEAKHDPAIWKDSKGSWHIPAIKLILCIQPWLLMDIHPNHDKGGRGFNNTAVPKYLLILPTGGAGFGIKYNDGRPALSLGLSQPCSVSLPGNIFAKGVAKGITNCRNCRNCRTIAAQTQGKNNEQKWCNNISHYLIQYIHWDF